MNLPLFTDPVSKEPSFSLTASAATVGLVLLRVGLGDLTIYGHAFAPIDDSTITTLLVPILSLYAVRKGTVAAENVALTKVAGERSPP